MNESVFLKQYVTDCSTFSKGLDERRKGEATSFLEVKLFSKDVMFI